MTIKVNGMSCGHCVASVKKLTEKFAKGEVDVSLEKGEVTFEPKDGFSKEDYLNELEEIGFDGEE